MPRRAAVHADALQDLAHPARAGGLQPLPREAALGLQPQVGEGRLVGVPGHVELVDDPPDMGQVLADVLLEPAAHAAGDEPHAPRHPVVVHEVPGEPFDRGRVPARGHVGHVVLDQAGDHGCVLASWRPLCERCFSAV